MLRRFIVPFIAFVLPFLLFALYRVLLGKKLDQIWPLTVLFIAGAVLAIQTFVLAAITEPHRVVRAPDPAITGPPIYKDHP